MLRRLLFLALALTLLALAPQARAQEDLDDDLDGIGSTPEKSVQSKPAKAGPSSSKKKQRPASERPGGIVGFRLKRGDILGPEGFAVAGVVVYFAHFFVGRRKNNAQAVAWAKEFCHSDALLQRQFSLVGSGHSQKKHQVLMKKSETQFQVWASGRRCGLLSACACLPAMCMMSVVEFTVVHCTRMSAVGKLRCVIC